jgi:cytochrome c oxidase cbb3-type subunit I
MVSAPSPSLVSEASAPAVERAETAAIDASARLPVLFLLGSAVVWLLVGSALALISSWKLVSPGFLDDCAWLTYGRVHPAQSNAFIYGWAVNASLALTLWLMARLSRAVLQGGVLLTVAAFFWNAGVALGLGGILVGDSTSFEWLEMPAYATPLLFFAYAMIAAWAFATFRNGRAKHLYVSQWYLFAALFWFPWFFSVAQILLFFAPVRGTLQSLVNAWYVHNVYGLWLTPVALAASYYFLPKLLGKPIHTYYLASFGFWWLAIFSSFAGASALIGGPVPAWVQGTGTAAMLMLLVPAFVVAINQFGTLSGSWGQARADASLRFIAFGLLAFIVSLLGQIAFSLRSVAELTQFTYAVTAIQQLGVYGFFSMTAFGAIYYVLPRVTGRTWPSPLLANVHFGASVVGILVVVVALLIAGFTQGAQMNDASVEFLAIVSGTKPFLVAATMGGLLLLVAHVAFALGVASFLKPAPAPAAFTSRSQTQVAAR